MTDERWRHEVHHPESDAATSIADCPALYAWHGRHHPAQIESLRERMGSGAPAATPCAS